MSEARKQPEPAGEVALSGGNMGAVVRHGKTVLRSAGSWTPTVHRLLEHLRAAGVDWLPRPLGLDEQGREVLTYLPGTVPTYPMPDLVWSEQVLATAGAWLARVHAASAGFDLVGAVWQQPPHEPAEVVCLNDVAPYNMVFDHGGHLAGWIDVDMASPGPRVWDLAYLAYRLVPLTGADDSGAGPVDLRVARDRLAALCAAYRDAGDRVGPTPDQVLPVVVDRLEDLADFTATRGAAGADHIAPHVALYHRDAAWVRTHAAALSGTGTGAPRVP